MAEKPAKSHKIVLKTPQSIVHIKHTVSLRQYKYWVLLLRFYREFFELNKKPDERGFYSVPIAKISDYMGYEPVKTELKTDFEVLRKEPIVINFLDKDGKKAMHGMGFISEWKITSKTIAFRIPSFLEDVMRGDNEATKIFQLLNWSIFNSFNGKYEAIIYKLCKDYIGIGRTPYMSMSEYREYIGLKDSEYTAIDNFTRRCITNPIKEINKSEITDIEISVEYNRNGRKLDGLYFKAKERKQTSIPFPEFEPHKAFALAKISISVHDQHKYLETMPPEEIEATIQRANEYGESIKTKGQKVQMGAIYHKAFTEHWGIQYLEQYKAEQTEAIKKFEAVKKQEIETEKEKTQQKTEREKTEKTFAHFEALPDSEKTLLIEEYISTVTELVRPTAQQAYKKYGVNAHKESVQFKGLFSGFLKKKIDGVLSEKA